MNTDLQLPSLRERLIESADQVIQDHPWIYVFPDSNTYPALVQYRETHGKIIGLMQLDVWTQENNRLDDRRRIDEWNYIEINISGKRYFVFKNSIELWRGLGDHFHTLTWWIWSRFSEGFCMEKGVWILLTRVRSMVDGTVQVWEIIQTPFWSWDTIILPTYVAHTLAFTWEWDSEGIVAVFTGMLPRFFDTWNMDLNQDNLWLPK